jgi:hypothetical protein
MKRFSAIWNYNTSTKVYTDLTSNCDTNTSFNFISITDEVFYFGFESRVTGFYCDLATQGSYTGVQYTYKSDSGWDNLQLIDTYTFSQSKYLRFVLPKNCIKFNFTDTDPNASEPPDNIERYWIKVSCSTVTTMAVISKLRAIPYVEYTTPDKVAGFLQVKKTFDNDTKPTDIEVENFIRRAEDRIDYKTKKSWRFNAVTEDTDPVFVDFNRFGMFLRHRNFYKVYTVQMWNGSTFTTLTEGRNSDYMVDYDKGFIYLTRQYLMPAVFGMTGRYSQWDVGEYKNAVKVDYIFGRDSETDREFYIVEDLANKIVAVNLLRHSDYTILSVSGADRASVGEKIANLEQEIEDQLDELSGVTLI